MVSIRRTTSLDALTSRPAGPHEWSRPITLHTLLLLHKHTQTPAAWVEEWTDVPPPGWCGSGVPTAAGASVDDAVDVTTAATSHDHRRRPHSNPCSPRHAPCSNAVVPSLGASPARRTLSIRRTPDRGLQDSPSSPPPLWCPSPSVLAPTALPLQGEPLDKFIRQSNDLICVQLNDGRRAPLPGCGLKTRSVNTQTTSSPHSASPHSPQPDYSPIDCSFSPVACSPSGSPLDSPTAEGDGKLRSNSSPHINKFLAREPPTGSQRVALRVRDGRCESAEPFVAPKPSVPFTLRPSLGSAFCPPQMRTSAAAGDMTGDRLHPSDPRDACGPLTQQQRVSDHLAPHFPNADVERLADNACDTVSSKCSASLGLDDIQYPSNAGLASLSDASMLASPAAGIQ
ncbi:uncharacterized protein LOC108682959 [Hyalella azteca]|uniref:Uncharacterized protein LOC108682959 n=1 Tax=Hyalella azteca TaxID=294128 RepID=A0A8B7PQG9_HYAAZ|nr:uncharacterized protein LOC108682959 [Hyalella azteca]